MSSEILFAVNFGNQVWVEAQAKTPVDFLVEHGLAAAMWDVNGKSGDELAAELETLRPRLVVNCAMFIHFGRLSNLARRFPAIRFLTTCHSSQADLARNNCWIRSQFEYMNVARELGNCYYSLMDERPEFAGVVDCPRMLHLPGCVSRSASVPRAAPHEPPVVSLICEWRALKNIPNQILAVALVQKRTPCKLLLSIGKDQRRMAATYAEGLELDFATRAWQPTREYLGMLARDVDIGLQASFTESFNYVGMDHLLLGKPVVGSPAIRYLPAAWQANPDDPRAIADALVAVLENYPLASERAKAAGEHQADKSNAGFLEAIRGLLE